MSRLSALTVESGTVPSGEGFDGHPTSIVLSVCVERLAIEQYHLGQLAVQQALAVAVNEPLYRLFSGVVSPLHRQIAQALCEEHVAPSSLGEHLGVPVQTITVVLRELVRLGVISISGP